MKARLDFGVVKGAEKAPKNNTKKEAELIMKLTNIGRVFTDMIISSKTEEEFIEKCKSMYHKCKGDNVTEKEDKE